MNPLISILVAARNEEDNILDLLNTIEALTYPKESLQVLIGNDNSTDRTAEIVAQFISQKPYYQLININSNLNNLKGKANVLAQLAHHAKGEYYFFTDADIELPKGWIEGILEEFNAAKNSLSGGSVAVVTGVTIIKNKTPFEACQSIEWLMALYLIKLMADRGIPSTGMGNNMATTAEAYWATGVEDYALFKAIIDEGFGFGQAFNPEIMAFTKPPKNYFQQRKRWVSGGMGTRSNVLFLALIQAFALPILLIISVFYWKLALGIFIFTFFLNLFLAYIIFKKMRLMHLLKYIPTYTIYMYVFWFLQLVNYVLPTKLIWKDREYAK
jgi:cellulose synthase/poly-beta-1,6-N-acetylglucosamine synthase-like glycosyltransferase